MGRTALASALLLAVLAANASASRPWPATAATRALLQAPSSPTALVRDLIAAKQGDQRARGAFVDVQYFYLGCGSSTRDREPGELAASLIGGFEKDPEVVEAGVVEVGQRLTREALAALRRKPPSKEDCDKIFS